MKKIFTKSLATVAATTILIPAVFAETSSGTISEETMTLSSASTTQNAITTAKVDNSEMWKKLHCAFLEKGFTWTAPTSNFVNAQICGNTISSEILNTPQLEAQRQLVRDYIVRLNGEKVENNSIPTVIDGKNVETYKNFIVELKNLDENFKILDENNIENYIKGAAEIFNKFSALPKEYQQLHTVILLEKTHKYSQFSREKIENFGKKYNFTTLNEWFALTADMAENEIAFSIIPLTINDTINLKTEIDGIVEKSFQWTRDNFMGFVDKNAKPINLFEYEISVTNAVFTKWNEYNNNLEDKIITFIDPREGNENLLEIVFGSKYQPKNETFEVILKNKKTGVIFTKKITIAPKGVTGTPSHLLEEMTSNEIQQIFK